jgi:tyrosine decarboxylase/aspartate 1-decarboxylase
MARDSGEKAPRKKMKTRRGSNSTSSATGVFPAKGTSRERVLSELDNAYDEDFWFGGGKILGSMCTEPHDIAIEAHSKFIEANLGNPGLYPGTRKLEEKVIEWLSALYHCKGCSGHLVGGGTEANITALWLARNMSPGKKEVVFPRSAHFSLRKACDLLAMRPVEIPMGDGFTIDIDKAARAVSKNTAAVVGIAGTTEVGAIDDIPALAEAADGAFLHVDAAFGGFILPFMPALGMRAPAFDFAIDGVSTLGTDPHKMGLSTIPSGAFMLRDEAWLDSISVDAPYLTQHRQTALSGTRCSAAVAATYAAIRHIGFEGYVKLVKGSFDVTRHLYRSLQKEGFHHCLRPPLTILNIAFDDPKRVQAALLRKGWHLSVAREPKSLRVVAMPHVTMKVADAFVEELVKTARELKAL